MGLSPVTSNKNNARSSNSWVWPIILQYLYSHFTTYCVTVYACLVNACCYGFEFAPYLIEFAYMWCFLCLTINGIWIVLCLFFFDYPYNKLWYAFFQVGFASTHFWSTHSFSAINERQRAILEELAKEEINEGNSSSFGGNWYAYSLTKFLAYHTSFSCLWSC